MTQQVHRTIPVELCLGPLDGQQTVVELDDVGYPPVEHVFPAASGDVPYRLACMRGDGVFIYVPLAP